MTKKIVILYSGGLDSFLMKKVAEKEYPDAEVKCVYYAHGAESERREISLLPDFVKVLNIDWLGKHGISSVSKVGEEHKGNIYIPGRNMVFATLAACQFVPDEVWLGALYDEMNDKGTDKNDVFKDKASDTLSYVLSPFQHSVKVSFPLGDRGWTKVDALRWVLKNTTTTMEEVVGNTSSCWHNDGHQCGECWQCVKRFISFRAATDNSSKCWEEYKVHPLSSSKSREMILNSLGSVPANLDEENMKVLLDTWLTAEEKELVRKQI